MTSDSVCMHLLFLYKYQAISKYLLQQKKMSMYAKKKKKFQPFNLTRNDLTFNVEIVSCSQVVKENRSSGRELVGY